MRSEQPLLADYLVEPMLGVTLTPTKAEGGKKANVIPSEAEALIDCRVPPGFGKEEARQRLEALIGERDYDIEFTEAVVGNSSPMESPLADAIRAWLGDADPGAEIAPMVMPGFSDSNPFRTAFPDAVVYGFCPYREVDLLHAAPLIHGADERIPVSDVEFSARFFYQVPRGSWRESTKLERRSGRPRRPEGRRGRGGPLCLAPRRDGAEKRPADPRPDLLGCRRTGPAGRDPGRLRPQAGACPGPGGSAAPAAGSAETGGGVSADSDSADEAPERPVFHSRTCG